MSDEVRSARIRLGVAAAAVVVVLGGTFGLLSLIGPSTRPKRQGVTAATATTTVASTTSSTVAVETPITGGDVAPPVDLAALQTPPVTKDPVVFARAYATALLSFDTRHETYAQRRARLWAWVPSQFRDADATGMLNDFLGGTDTWDALRQIHGSQTIVISRAWIPASILAARKKYPAQYAAAGGVWAVTLAVTRQLRGDPGANTDLGLTLTVLIRCPDGHTCSAYAPGRSTLEN